MKRNVHVTNTNVEYDADFYQAIYDAIIKSAKKGVDVKKELGEDLIVTLDQLQFAFYTSDRRYFEEFQKSNYQNMSDILGFNLIESENTDEDDVDRMINGLGISPLD